jgi:hypothetical protein
MPGRECYHCRQWIEGGEKHDCWTTTEAALTRDLSEDLLCVFLGRTLKTPRVRRIDRASKSKVVHFFHIRHRDEVEAPITDWLQEAYELSAVLSARPRAKDPAHTTLSRARATAKGARKKKISRKKAV